MAGDSNFSMADARQGYWQALNAMNAGTYKASGDIIDWSLWDTVTVDNAVGLHRMFINGLGVVVAGAARTLADTNVEGRQGGIPQGQKLYVKAIKVFYTQDDDVHTEAFVQQFYAMLEQTTINIVISGKASYGQWTLAEMFGTSIGMIMEPAAAADNYTLGTVARSVGVLPLNLPIVLASNVTFDVTLQHWTAPNANLDGDKIKLALCGILERLS